MAIAAPIVPSPAPAVAAARAALTEALLLKVGQVLQALVVGTTADDLTTLKVGDQVLMAKLPLSLPPGSVLQLQVKLAGSVPQLQIVAPATAASGPAMLKPGAATAPVTDGTPSPTMAADRQSVPAPNQPSAAPPLVKAVSIQGAAPMGSEIESRLEPPAAGPRSASASAESAPTRPSPTSTAPATIGESAPAPKVSLLGLQVTPPASDGPPARIVIGAPHTEAVNRATASPPMQWPAPSPAASASNEVPASTADPSPIRAPTGSAVREPATSMGSTPTVDANLKPSLPAAVHSLLIAQSAPRPPFGAADSPRMVPAPASPPQVPGQGVRLPPPPLPGAPQAALAQMLPEALSRQDSTAPLLTSLAAAVQRPGLLPEPILRAALGVLAQRIIVSGSKVQAAQIEQAVSRSGVTLEASLLRADPQPRDAKAGLLVLREALGRWLGNAPGPLPTDRDVAPPPIKGLPLRAAMIDPPPALPDLPRDVGRLLHSQADAAVSRVKLMQLASLPDADPGKPAPMLRLELPFLIGHELVMAQIQIGRDGARREAERRRGWMMRFALNFSATGEVGAEVGVLAKAVNVSLWAAEAETASAMAEALPELTRALAAIGLKPGALRVRHGTPVKPRRQQSGQLLDSVS